MPLLNALSTSRARSILRVLEPDTVVSSWYAWNPTLAAVTASSAILAVDTALLASFPEVIPRSFTCTSLLTPSTSIVESSTSTSILPA